MSEEKSCLGCKERHIGCHSDCEHYKRRRERADEVLRRREAQMKAREDADSIAFNGLRRAMRRRRNT